MTVYVDTLLDWGWRLGPSCHMTADSEGELHTFAARVGLKRSWFQGPPKHRLPHYDLTRAIRARAVRFGATEISTRDMAKRLRPQRHWVAETQADSGEPITYSVHGDPNMSEESRVALDALAKAAYAQMQDERTPLDWREAVREQYDALGQPMPAEEEMATWGSIFAICATPGCGAVYSVPAMLERDLGRYARSNGWYKRYGTQAPGWYCPTHAFGEIAPAVGPSGEQIEHE